MKNTKFILIILAILVCFSQALRGMEEPPTLPENFAQLPTEMQKEITSQLSDRDLVSLAQTSKQTSQVLEDELEKRHLQAAIELSLWESRIKIDFWRKVDYPRFNKFKQAVLNRLEEIAKQKPDQWICLNLSDNDLRLLSIKGLNAFIQSIAKYNIVELALASNNLTYLPEKIFNNLPKLQKLNLYNNQLSYKERQKIKKALPHVEISF